MRKPERAVMLVVMLFVGRVLHWPIAGHGHLAGTHERVAIGPGHVLENVFGEKLAVDLNADTVSQLGELDALFGRRRGIHVRRSSSGNQGQEAESDSKSHEAMTRHNPAILRRPVVRVNLKRLSAR